MKGVLTFDLGASSGRCILSTYNGEKLEMRIISRFSDYVIHKKNNMYWDINYIFEEIKSGIRKAEEIGSFDTIGIDTWGVDFGLLDEDGVLLEEPYHYRDARTTGSLKKVTQSIELDEIYKKTGLQIMEINTLFQLYTFKNEQYEIYKRAKTLLLMPDLINYLLTGEKKTERTIASTSQLYNPNLRDWDYELINKLGLNDQLFTKIVDPGECIGYITNEIKEELGIGDKKVIAVASHDTASAVLCTPHIEKENLFLSSGTWSLIGTQLNSPIINMSTYNYNLSNESGADNKITLLKNITGLWLIQESKRQFEREGRHYSFDEISNLAMKAKPIDCYFDTESPELKIPGDIPKRIKILAKKTNQAVPNSDGEILRVIYENLALKYREAFEEIKNCVGNNFKTIYIVGGGSKANFLSQCTANALNLKVVAGYSEATALGNTIVQLLSQKIISNYEEGKNIIRHSYGVDNYMPEEIALWNEKYNQYKLICQEEKQYDNAELIK